MRLKGVEAVEIEKSLEQAPAGDVAFQSGEQVAPEGGCDGRIVGDRLREGVADRSGRNRFIAEPGGDAMNHGVFEGRAVEDRIDEQRRESAFRADGFLRFKAQSGPKHD